MSTDKRYAARATTPVTLLPTTRKEIAHQKTGNSEIMHIAPSPIGRSSERSLPSVSDKVATASENLPRQLQQAVSFVSTLSSCK